MKVVAKGPHKFVDQAFPDHENYLLQPGMTVIGAYEQMGYNVQEGPLHIFLGAKIHQMMPSQQQYPTYLTPNKKWQTQE